MFPTVGGFAPSVLDSQCRNNVIAADGICRRAANLAIREADQMDCRPSLWTNHHDLVICQSNGSASDF
jgi:hypothetical protein